MFDLKDLMKVLDFLMATKTPSVDVAEAMERLRSHHHAQVAQVTHHSFTADPLTAAAPRSEGV